MVPYRKASLLIVDDEPMTCFLLERIFASRGHRVRTAQDGFAALRCIRDEVPDVLLSDLNMPGMSGFELLSVVRRRLPRVYVVASSGAHPEDLPAGIPADALHAKSSGVAALLSMVEDAPVQAPGLGVERPAPVAPIWVAAHEEALHIASEGRANEAWMVSCPECLRSFRLGAAAKAREQIFEIACLFCRASISYALVPDPATVARRSTLQTQ